ncbi:PF09365 family protein [Leptospira kirschneri serovar Grippotyphosa str. Moskva]|nr:PF09365 family protein [Leptospira kirschneri serovar Grippotyphosa str. Moskva]
MLHLTTLDFLKKLAKNNNKVWLEKNKESFVKAKEDFENLITELIVGLAKINPLLTGVDPKKCIFRIYRDVRFSKNKEPYKINFGASIGEVGKDLGKPLFYLHVQPRGESFLAGGLYMPDSPTLKKVREYILKNSNFLKKVVQDKEFLKEFGGLSDMKLKTYPKGFAKDHPDLEWIQYTSYIVEKKTKRRRITFKVFYQKFDSVL